MAKDGTRRGGARVGAGRKPKPLTDKISESKPAQSMLEPMELLPDDEISDLPLLKDFMTAEQKCGVSLDSETIYMELYHYLKSRGCETLVSQQLMEQYVMSVARWIQCEQAISATGFISKHPTTGGAIASPFVQMSQSYMKQINAIWYQINQIVKENSSGTYQVSGDPMELLLNSGE